MSSPMFEMPDHFAIPVDINGDGPADPEDTVALVCVCAQGRLCPILGEFAWKPAD